MIKDDHDKTVLVLIFILVLFFSLLHYFIPPYTLLITSSLCIFIAFSIILLYKKLFTEEYKKFSIFTLVLFLVSYIFIREAFLSLGSIDNRSIDSLFKFKSIEGENVQHDKNSKKNESCDDHPPEKEKEKIKNEVISQNLRNKKGSIDQLTHYTHNKKIHYYSSPVIAVTSAISMCTYVFAIPIILGVLFCRFLFQFIKQQHTIENSLDEGNYTDLLLIITYILVNASTYATLISIVTDADGLFESAQFFAYFAQAMMLCLCCDLSDGLLTSILVSIGSNAYILLRCTVRYFVNK
ncbi:hypothetical protein M153_11250001020 [Pseudoloma neurophilia]|uniref:Uncharacterized protein n=1 Tax=Pseudoloma neurophilia TaxID=146866 RepID=A0A0R0M2N4_9MICR|nr:hypothetical protein M153_11250001020 [Pseudoloma neurophilia]